MRVKTIGVFSQKKSDIEDPTYNDLSIIGTVAHIMKMLRMPDSNITAIIQGRKLIKLNQLVQEEPFLKTTVTELFEDKPHKSDEEFIALVDSIKDIALQIVKESPNIPSEAQLAIQNIESPSYLVVLFVQIWTLKWLKNRAPRSKSKESFRNDSRDYK